MNKNKKYTIATQGGSSPFFLNGYFTDNQTDKIPGIVGEGFISFFDEKYNTVLFVNKQNIIWIKENDRIET